MVLKGSFDTLSIAVYGQIAPQEPVDDAPPSYAPAYIHKPDSYQLSPALDLSSTTDPTFIARKILASFPGAPSLPEIVRQLSCYRAVGSSTAEPDALFADIEWAMNFDGTSSEWLDQAVATLRLPVPDLVSDELLLQFFGKVKTCLNEVVCFPTQLLGFPY